MIATWNVRSLFQPGTSRRLEEELKRYSVEIAAIQEIRWRNTELIDLGEYTIINSGHTENIYGTGFMISKRIKQALLSYKTVNERICVLRTKGRFFNYTFISVHAPTEEKDEEEKETFYEELEREYDGAPRHDIKIVLGDFNAKVGQESEFRPTIGGQSLHRESNDNGIRLIDFATAKNMIVSSTTFEHKKIHKETWVSPDGSTKNQIDHILIDARHASNVQDIRSYRGGDVDSDHFLVRAKLKQRLAVRPRGRGERRKIFDQEGLNDEIKKKDFMERVEESLKNGKDEESVEELWKDIKEALLNTAEEVLGKSQRVVRNDWYDEEVRKILEKRNRAREMFLQRTTRATRMEYTTCRREAKKICREKKRNMEKKMIEEMQQDFVEKRSRKFFKHIKNRKNGFQPRISCIRNKRNELISDTEDILSRWAEYFEEVLNPEILENNKHEEETPDLENDERTENLANCNSEPPTIEEVKDIVTSMKNKKAPGVDGITTEMLKCGGPVLIQRLHRLILKIWQSEKIPEEWETAIICPIFKKGDRLKCEHYRGISLLCIGYKILTVAIAKRIIQKAETDLGEYQCGFRPNRSTMDHIFTMKIILEKCYEHNITLNQLYIDFRQAYDSVRRGRLLTEMKVLGYPCKLIRLVRMALKESKCKVSIQGGLSRTVEVRVGLRQGDPMSSVLFNIALETAIRKISANREGNIYNRLIQILAYADDVVIIARTKSALESAFKEMNAGAMKMGLNVNIDKTKFVESARTPRPINPFKCGEVQFEGVQEFKYLGVMISSQNEIKREIGARLSAGNRCYAALMPTLRSKQVSRRAKLTIYKTILRPVVTYGAETWVLTKADEKRLMTWERKVMRKIFGPKKTDVGWSIRTNREIRELYQEQDLVSVIKTARVRWLGHAWRMDDTRDPKKVLKGQPGGKRHRGRPRKRWLDDVEEDFRTIGIRRWRVKAQDRTEWNAVIAETKGLQGP